MTGWHLAHLLILGLWGGLVLAESVVELALRDQPAAVARAHYYIDLTCELPLLLGVLVTGGVLTASSPLTTLLMIKLGCGLFAVAVNLWCVPVVLRRHRNMATASPAEIEDGTRKVFWALKLGFPAGLVALCLGLGIFLGLG